MKEIEIDLAQPFEKVFAAVLALPNGSLAGAQDDGTGEQELKQALRGLYEAANGRQVETEIGLIAIAPPIAPFLKAVPLRAATLKDFMVAAAAQIVSLPLHWQGRSPASPIANRRRNARNQRRPAPEKINLGAIQYPASPKISETQAPQLTAAHHD
jgi:hypothetical protein